MFEYDDFEDIVPGGTVPMLAEQAKELRDAIIERADAIGVDVSGTIPAAISPGDPTEVGWLTGMRTALEVVITGAKYGRFTLVSTNPVFTVWDKESLLTEVHAVHVPSWPDCGSGSDWISVSASDPPLAVHIRELFYACEVLAYADQSFPTFAFTGEEHRLGSGQGPGVTESFQAAQADWATASWESGWAGNYLSSYSSSVFTDPDYTTNMRDERCSDIALTVPGSVGLREVHVCAVRYESSTGGVAFLGSPTLYKGADFGTLMTDYIGSQDNGAQRWVKFDYFGEELAPADVFHISMDMSSHFGDGDTYGYPDPNVAGYAGQLVSAYWPSGGPDFVVRYNFTKSKFLWTLPTPV